MDVVTAERTALAAARARYRSELRKGKPPRLASALAHVSYRAAGGKWQSISDFRADCEAEARS